MERDFRRGGGRRGGFNHLDNQRGDHSRFSDGGFQRPHEEDRMFQGGRGGGGRHINPGGDHRQGGGGFSRGPTGERNSSPDRGGGHLRGPSPERRVGGGGGRGGPPPSLGWNQGQGGGGSDTGRTQLSLHARDPRDGGIREGGGGGRPRDDLFPFGEGHRGPPTSSHPGPRGLNPNPHSYTSTPGGGPGGMRGGGGGGGGMPQHRRGGSMDDRLLPPPPSSSSHLNQGPSSNGPRGSSPPRVNLGGGSGGFQGFDRPSRPQPSLSDHPSRQNILLPQQHHHQGQGQQQGQLQQQQHSTASGGSAPQGLNPLGSYYRSSGAFGSMVIEGGGREEGQVPSLSTFALPPPPPPFQPNLIIPPPSHLNAHPHQDYPSYQQQQQQQGPNAHGQYNVVQYNSLVSPLAASGSSTALFNLHSQPAQSSFPPLSSLSDMGGGLNPFSAGSGGSGMMIPGLGGGGGGGGSGLGSYPSLSDLDPSARNATNVNQSLTPAASLVEASSLAGSGALASAGSVRRFGQGIARRSSATAAANVSSQKPGMRLGLGSGSVGDLAAMPPPLPASLSLVKQETGIVMAVDDELPSPNDASLAAGGGGGGGVKGEEGPLLKVTLLLVAHKPLVKETEGEEGEEGDAMDVDKEEEGVGEGGGEYLTLSIEVLGLTSACPSASEWPNAAAGGAAGDVDMCEEEEGGGMVRVDSATHQEEYAPEEGGRGARGGGEEEDEEDEDEGEEEEGVDQEAKARRRAAEIAAETAPLLSSSVLGNNIEALETIFMDLEKLHLSLAVKGKQNRVQLMMLEEEEAEVDEEVALLDEEAAVMAEELEAEAEAAAAAATAGEGEEGRVKEEPGVMDVDSSAPLPSLDSLAPGTTSIAVDPGLEEQAPEAPAVTSAQVKEEGGEAQGLPPGPPPLEAPPGLPPAPKPINPLLQSLEAQKMLLMRSAQLHLAPPFLERVILAANRKTAERASERMLRTLPPDLADKARLSGPCGSIAVLPPIYNCPQEAPSWAACEERHAENVEKGAVVGFLKVRAMLAAAKQKALAEQYSDYASQMVNKAATATNRRKETLCSSTQPPTGNRFNRNSSSGALGPSFNPQSYGGTINSDYEEALVMQNFEAVEMLQTMCYIPDQCIDPWERRWKAYDDRNGLQEDPWYDEKARRAAKEWTAKEKELFKEKILLYPKDFLSLSDCFPGRSPGDCVDYFYKHQHLPSFSATRRKLKKEMKRLRRIQYHPPRPPPVPVAAPPLTARQQALIQGGGPGVLAPAPSVSVAPLGMKVKGGRELAALGIVPTYGTETHLTSPRVSSVAQPTAATMAEDQTEGTGGVHHRSSSVVKETAKEPSDGEFIDALRRHGKDYASISSELGMKGPGHAKTLFTRHRLRLQLDSVLAERGASTAMMAQREEDAEMGEGEVMTGEGEGGGEVGEPLLQQPGGMDFEGHLRAALAFGAPFVPPVTMDGGGGGGEGGGGPTLLPPPQSMLLSFQPIDLPLSLPPMSLSMPQADLFGGSASSLATSNEELSRLIASITQQQGLGFSSMLMPMSLTSLLPFNPLDLPSSLAGLAPDEGGGDAFVVGGLEGPLGHKAGHSPPLVATEDERPSQRQKMSHEGEGKEKEEQS